MKFFLQRPAPCRRPGGIPTLFDQMFELSCSIKNSASFWRPVLATRATQKEYSGEPGSQNDPKMEPKMEPKGTRTKK